MKKIQIVFLFIFCFFSFNVVHAETLIIKSVDKRIEDIEKAREKLQKDSENNYKQLQDQLKSISATINTNQTGISAQEEYEYQLKVYELKSEIACINKEGLYSSFNKETKQCECVEGSTFANGKCVNRIDNLLMCVKTFGPLAYYNYDKDGCVCYEGSEFDWSNNGFCTAKEKTNTITPMSVAEWIKAGKPKSPEAPKKLVVEKKTITSIPEVKPVLEANTTEKMAIKPDTQELQPTSILPQDNPQKTTFWQRVKNNILKIKFW